MTYTTLQVPLGSRHYPIYIGSGILSDSSFFRRHITGNQVLVVSNETVAPLYQSALLAGLGDYEVHTIALPDGEQFKTIETWARIFDVLIEHRFGRDSTIVALGGGVVGDIAGFAAACYQRGVRLMQVPTTLLAHVDSSVGGKTGVNHPAGKNMIGAFHQPAAVLIDTQTLETLPDRELRAGIAEVIKYGLIRDPEFFSWLESRMEALLDRNHETLAEAIERSCRNKADVVAADEKESGQRALLNLGHTFGHAIETGVGYGSWLHGEAVAAGTCMAARFSHILGWLDSGEVERIVRLIETAGLPVAPPSEIEAGQFLDIMAVDKKVLGGRVRLVLLRAIGESTVTDQFDPNALREFVQSELR